MPKFKDFSLGVNNANPIDQIDDRELAIANNVEYKNSSNLEKREGIKTSELNDALSQLFITGTVTKFKAWAPKITPNDAYDSYVYIIYTTSFEVYVIYKLDANTWGSYQLVIDNITYTSSSVMSFAKAVDRIILTDSVNKAHFIKLDQDGLFIEGVMEYPAPKYIPKIEVMTEYKDENFETNSEEGYLGECGLYIYCWCYADKWLNLSNPSPFSEPVDRQFFSFDAETGDPDKWVESLRISNMKIPVMDVDTKKNIKFIYLFRKYFKHTEDLINIDWDLYNVYEIPSVDAFNEFLDFSDTAEGQTLDYGNTAPVALQSLTQGNSVFLAGCKTKDQFLWNHEWAFPISVNNRNNDIKVNKIYRVRISESIVGKRDGAPIFPFDLDEHFIDYDGMKDLCFMAQDKTTPIKSMLITTGTVPGGSVGYFDAFIQIPELHPGINIIFFNFTTLNETDNYAGITSEFLSLDDRYSYGRMLLPYDIGSIVADGWEAQTMFTIKHGSLENSRNIVNCPMLMKGDDDNVLNRYDDEWDGVATGCTWVDRIAKIPALKDISDDSPLFGDKAIRLNSESSKIVFGDNIDADNDDNVNVSFWYKFNTGNIKRDIEEFPPESRDEIWINTIIGNCYANGDGELMGWTFGIRKKNMGDDYETYFSLFAGTEDHSPGNTTHSFAKEYRWGDIDIIDYFGADTNTILFISLSFNPGDKKAWLYVIDKESNVLIDGEVSLSWDDYDYGSDMQVGVGKIDDDYYFAFYDEYPDDILYPQFQHRAIPNSVIQGISYTKNRTVDSVNSAINLANFMHYTEGNKLIGYNWVDLSAYNNITIQEGYPVEYKEKNSVMWASANSVSFKLTNQKEFFEAHSVMLSAPYFIKTEYGNSVLEITRNTINRINLSGTPDEWALDSNNFITEYANLGALSPKGWGTFRDRVFGHTESGFIMWTKEEFRIISNRKVRTAGGFADIPRLVVPKKNTLISFPNPLRNQYIWHDNAPRLAGRFSFRTPNQIYYLDGGNFAEEGFTVGQHITVSGTNYNDGEYTISAIYNNRLTVEESVVGESSVDAIISGNPISYVYHIDQDAFTIFTGLDIVETDTIDKGDNLENLVIMLTSSGVFKLYPDVGTYFDGTAQIETKGFELEDSMIKKFIPKFDGDSCDIIVVSKNRDGLVTRTHAGSLSEAIQYVKNGAWGTYYYFAFGGSLEKLYDIETILQRRF